MDPIKEAFQKVKEDIEILKEETEFLRKNISEILEQISSLSTNLSSKPLNIAQDLAENNPTIQHINPTHSTETSTDDLPFKPLKPQNLGISTGNGGVPTDKQTNKQTNRQTQNEAKKDINSLDGALDILNSLDSIKKEIRLKFKRLTNQEFLVFSAIYQFDEEIGYSDYKLLSQKLGLSESSIRDYVGRLIKKGISVDKIKVNNKYVRLSLSEKLRKVATLSTILQLREL